jgi:hypothetical protein
MRCSLCCTFALAALAFVPVLRAQAPAGGPPAQEEKAKAIANGGIFVPGWKATVDANAVKQGQSEKDSSFKQEGSAFHVMTGPALTYWNPKNAATGDYTVMATFNEPQYMNRNDHPHPYGIFVAGNDMGTPNESGLYCAAYGNGNFIVRGFGPAPFQVNGRRGEANDAVHKAAGPGQPVSQAISVQVKGDSVSCIINGATVGTYKKADLVAPGKLKSTDGVAGIRFAHNTDATVSDFMVMKP